MGMALDCRCCDTLPGTDAFKGERFIMKKSKLDKNKNVQFEEKSSTRKWNVGTFSSSTNLLAADMRNEFSEEPEEIPRDMGGRVCSSQQLCLLSAISTVAFLTLSKIIQKSWSSGFRW
ncbi:hypothetical protein STEG23_016097 [Scotinomys teguina]